jgi:hypothetical protein
MPITPFLNGERSTWRASASDALHSKWSASVCERVHSGSIQGGNVTSPADVRDLQQTARVKPSNATNRPASSLPDDKKERSRSCDVAFHLTADGTCPAGRDER